MYTILKTTPKFSETKIYKVETLYHLKHYNKIHHDILGKII